MMELKFDKIGNVLKITVDGRLVAACSEEFKETVSGWLADNRFLLFVLQKANAQDGPAKLACLQPRPRIVFDITKVYRIFEIFDSVDAALASFGAEAK